MKKWLAGLLTALLLAVLTAPVMASDDIDARLNRQQERLNRLANSGEIAPREQHRLERKLNQIRERSKDLERSMDSLDKDIDQARHQPREIVPGVPIPSIPTPR